MTSIIEQFNAGELDGAVTMALSTVREHPQDVSARSLLCELLCFSGDLERADRQLDTIIKLDPQTAPGVTLMRHLIRAETCRREVFDEGRVPEFLEGWPPDTHQQQRMQAMLALREGNGELAAGILTEISQVVNEVSGTLNGKAFQGFRDLDDLLGPVFEVFTASGKYYWIETSQLVSLDFEPVTHLSDLLWRSATIETTGNVTGRVYLPALYHGSATSEDGHLRTGGMTDWLQQDDVSPVRGCGRREFQVGEDAVSILEITSLQFERG